MTVKEIKSTLLQECIMVVTKRHDKVKQTIAGIIESLEGESRSTAGDKHDTGRAMLQIDRENAGKQLREIENLQKIIPRIDISNVTDYARLGSLVYTNQATYFISISIGAIMVSETNYLCVAYSSPIGQLLSGKKQGEAFEFNQKTYKITSVK